MTCEDCRFCVFQDDGYSNYTVENTSFNCAKRLHPDGSFDRFYGTDERLKYAETCAGFEAGECIEMDVEQEGLADLTEAQKEVWKMYEEAP